MTKPVYTEDDIRFWQDHAKRMENAAIGNMADLEWLAEAVGAECLGWGAFKQSMKEIVDMAREQRRKAALYDATFCHTS